MPEQPPPPSFHGRALLDGDEGRTIVRSEAVLPLSETKTLGCRCLGGPLRVRETYSHEGFMRFAEDNLLGAVAELGREEG